MTPQERDAITQIDPAFMLTQVETWAAINSGTTNLIGLKQLAACLADAFSSLPGEIRLIDPDPVETVDENGHIQTIRRGQHLHVRVRPDAPIRVLLTGHMDTVFAADHPFQTLNWIEPGILNGPGTADMKGGIAVIHAALTALERHDRHSRGRAVQPNFDS